MWERGGVQTHPDHSYKMLPGQRVRWKLHKLTAPTSEWMLLTLASTVSFTRSLNDLIKCALRRWTEGEFKAWWRVCVWVWVGGGCNYGLTRCYQNGFKAAVFAMFTCVWPLVLALKPISTQSKCCAKLSQYWGSHCASAGKLPNVFMWRVK